MRRHKRPSENMNPETYTRSGTSALERRYPITKAISGNVVEQDLLAYDLIIFCADGLLLEGTLADQPYPNRPDEWRLRAGVKDWFQSIQWTSSEQSPCLAFIGDSPALSPVTLHDAYGMLNAFIDTLVEDIHTPIVVLLNSVKDKTHPDRKPSPGLLLRAMKACEIPASRSLYVGDMQIDPETAPQALVDYCHPRVLFGK